ncbi:MAG: ABC transporter ATP-binding protein [Acidobacteria bacterium]|nr:MAG: ABC transporter ATP-binding protein [Acidobacteriota bacterium]PYS11517.1 MAG: ABC transporter ATP-binding protein [Acidobacteriota bacterium]
MKSLLETADLRKTYTVGKIEIEALRGVDLRIREGELVAVMGPSGCGKSTLMHVLGAMTKPTAGKVFIDGQEISGMSDSELTGIRRDKIGFVFQKFNLLPTLTARGNIEIARYIHGKGVASNGHDQHLREILQLLMIEGKMERKPSELSGGEQQRVAIARAVANKPAILLADEPTGSLDSKNSEVVLNMFRELNRRFKQTIILVTHNPELVAFTDRLIEMRDGVIVSDNDSLSWDTENELAQPARSV